jgi:hypothetical protein
MTRQELQKELTGKGIIFVNRLVKALGGKKIGSKNQDIEEILGFYDETPERVVSAFETAELTRKSRFSKIKDAFHEIRNDWEKLVEFIATNENVPQAVQDAVEKIDSIIDAIFPVKD